MVKNAIVTVIIVFILLAFNSTSFAHSLQENREYNTVRIKTPPRIDGYLNEDVWKNIDYIREFIQDYPEEGEAPTESTWVKVIYDDEAIYAAFYCFDSKPEKVISRLARRDHTNGSDFVKIEIDSYHDHLTGYMFEITAAGVLVDAYRYNDGWRDGSWNAVWEGDAKLTSFGWTAEIKIPYSALRFNNHRLEHEWGMNLVRYIARKDEVPVWSYVPPESQGWNSRFGHLKGIKGIEPSNRLEVLPYAVSSGETEPKSLGNADGRDFSSDIGVDVKYGLGSNLTLDASVNPDFGQVEADAAVLNLSTFETYYPEKRPFFIEGNKYFETKFDLFYSRRVGRSPGNWPDDADYYLTEPDKTTILGAGKITGRTESGWVIGVMNSVTDREKAKYIDENGVSKTTNVEEPANYNASRIKREFDNGSSLGIIGTSAHQIGETPIYTGGIDWDLTMKDRQYSWDGQVVGSQNSNRGWGLITRLEKESGKHIHWAFGGEFESKELKINRLGFLGRNNYHGGWGWWQYRDTENPFIFRDMYNNLNYWYGYNLDGDLINVGGNYNCSFTFKNNWSFGGGYEIEPSHYDDRETRDGPLYKVPSSTAGWQWFEMNPMGGRYNWGYSWTYGGNRDGKHGRLTLWSSWKLADNFEISFEPSYRLTWDQSRWVTDDEDADSNRVDIFGELDTKTFDFSLRGTYVFTRDMSLVVYTQLFFASGDYSNFKELASPSRFKPLTVTYDENPDFLSKSINLNIVYRWEYMPGSVLYVVFTQARDDETEIFNDLSLKRDTDDLFQLSASNLFLVKLSYWWNP